MLATGRQTPKALTTWYVSSNRQFRRQMALQGTKPSVSYGGFKFVPLGKYPTQVYKVSLDEATHGCRQGSFCQYRPSQLYVVQHVLRGAWRPYELNKRCEEIRWKPEQQKMEVDLRMDHENYNHEQSEPLNIKKQTLSSTTMVSSHIQYAIGFLEKHKFYLNPVHAILQLRPSSASLPDDLPNEEIVSETAEASSNPIEPWVVLQYHPIDSPLSNKIKQKMAVEVVKNTQFMTRSDYLHSLPSRKLADETVTRASSMRMQKLGKEFSVMIDSQASDSVETKTEHNADSSFKRDGDVIESLAEQSIPIETHKHIRRGVLEIFNYKTVLSFQSIVSGLQEIACWSPLKNDVKTRLLVNAAALAVSAPEKDLRSVIEQVAVRVHGVYVLKTAGNPALDPLRNVVISLYQAREPNAKLRKKKVKQAAQSCLNIDISDNEYYQVMRELCIPKKFSWELKSGE
ncbi:hypothetical protein KFK09_028477 [Dendrobium nobile]|uniref:Uncharacterized protein n=1 Tax=Dendrobium nobile TaxID=94219 RepID=A0A8T3A2K7_DENNO|nr:hypothetical protein KFK09_028477 [Dendrobium nobile]